MAWFSYSLSFLGHLLRFTTLDTALHDDARVYHKHYYSRESVFLWRASPINCQPLGASLAYLYCSSAREGRGWYSVSEILTPNCLLNFSFWQSQHQTFWANLVEMDSFNSYDQRVTDFSTLFPSYSLLYFDLNTEYRSDQWRRLCNHFYCLHNCAEMYCCP